MVSGRLDDPARPPRLSSLADMLVEIYERYGRPVFISETGGEGSARAAWFHYVCDEVREAIRQGAEVAGPMPLPVVSFPAGTTNATGSSACSATSLVTAGAKPMSRWPRNSRRQQALLDQERTRASPRAVGR
jgi:hypothetical protein